MSPRRVAAADRRVAAADRGRGAADRSRRVGAAPVVLAALVLAGCGGPAPAPVAPPVAPSRASYADAPCPNPIYPGVAAVDLGPEFRCGYLTVPQDRAKADGRTIRIPVARARAAAPDPAPDPILYLTGGPGGSGLLSAAQRVQHGWNARRDVIFIDQRGTWKADPLLACPEIDAFQREAVGLATADPATAGRSAAATRACRDRVVAQGWDPAAYDTTENAADVADLRVALGIGQWNVYGVSYGTDLALQLVRDHPQGVRSLVLDSVVPPQQNTIDSFWPSAAHGFTALADACAAQPECARRYPTLRADLADQVTRLTARPRTVRVPDPAGGRPVDVLVDGYKLANIVVTASLVPGSFAPVPEMIDNLARGDGTQAAAQVLAGVPPSGVTGYGLALGVFCSESVAFTDPARLAARAAGAQPGFPAEVLRLPPQAPWIFGDCRAWEVPPAPTSAAAPPVSPVPALLVSGALDGITAPPNAEVAATGLTRSRRLVFPGAGHDVLLWSPECAVPVMHSFLDHVDDPAPVDTGCVDRLVVPPFTTP